jgi:hypothetical protein
MKTPNLPYHSANEQRLVNDYGRNSDGKKTKYREALERIARSDMMIKPIPINELDKYKTAELAIYTVENERRETVEQVELISKEAEFADKVRTDINNCNTINEFIHLLHKYSELHTNKAFRTDVINRATETLIKQSENENDLIDIWNVFKCISVKDDPDDLLINKIKSRKQELL